MNERKQDVLWLWRWHKGRRTLALSFLNLGFDCNKYPKSKLLKKEFRTCLWPAMVAQWQNHCLIILRSRVQVMPLLQILKERICLWPVMVAQWQNTCLIITRSRVQVPLLLQIPKEKINKKNNLGFVCGQLWQYSSRTFASSLHGKGFKSHHCCQYQKRKWQKNNVGSVCGQWRQHTGRPLVPSLQG